MRRLVSAPLPVRTAGRDRHVDQSTKKLEPLTMATSSTSSPTRARVENNHTNRTVRRSTETKASFKTTEFMSYVAVVIGVLVAAMLVDETNGGGFGARQAW